MIFFELADKILESDEAFLEKAESPKCCKPSQRTICVQSREAVWGAFEKPETSFIGKVSTSKTESIIILEFTVNHSTKTFFSAKAINIASIFFIILSTVSFCLETIPHFHQDNCETKEILGTNGDMVNRSYERMDHDPERYTITVVY